jgi:23S rRNA-/tRNA-specific pseudouridylate synthase
MILGLSNKTASELSAEFREGNIKKEYIARCKGEFPAYVFFLPLDTPASSLTVVTIAE